MEKKLKPGLFVRQADPNPVSHRGGRACARDSNLQPKQAPLALAVVRLLCWSLMPPVFLRWRLIEHYTGVQVNMVGVKITLVPQNPIS